jgi:hypothetical protein
MRRRRFSLSLSRRHIFVEETQGIQDTSQAKEVFRDYVKIVTTADPSLEIHFSFCIVHVRASRACLLKFVVSTLFLAVTFV